MIANCRTLIVKKGYAERVGSYKPKGFNTVWAGF